jgi:hypothetical protein
MQKVAQPSCFHAGTPLQLCVAEQGLLALLGFNHIAFRNREAFGMGQLQEVADL